MDIAFGLVSIGWEASLFLEESEIHLTDKINSVTNHKVPIVSYSENNINDSLKNENIDLILIEDNMKMMRWALKAISNKINKAVYVQYLYGVNTNREEKRKSSMALLVGSNIPWKLMTSQYKSLLSKFDYVIPNSQTCGYILRLFYDVSPSRTVYPPVGTDMRPLLDTLDPNTKKEGVLVFAGNIKNDSFSRDVVAEILNLAKTIQEPINLFISNPDTKAFFKNKGIKTYSSLSVYDLTQLYFRSKVTYVPTNYELFGHVGAESLLCGTPVILDAYHPFLESFPMETFAVKISNPLDTISDTFLKLVNENVDINTAKNSILKRYSSVESARAFLDAVRLR